MSTSPAQRIFSVLGRAAPAWAKATAPAPSSFAPIQMRKGRPHAVFRRIRSALRLNGTWPDRFRPVGKIQAQRAKQGRERLVLIRLDTIQRPGGKRSSDA